MWRINLLTWRGQKTNYNKTAGYMQEEINGMDGLQKEDWQIHFAVCIPT